MMGFWDQVQSRPTLRIFEKIKAGELRFIATLATTAALVGAELRVAVAEYYGTGRKLLSSAALVAARLGTPLVLIDAGQQGKILSSAALVGAILREALVYAAFSAGKITTATVLFGAVLRTAAVQLFAPGVSRQLRTSICLQSAILA